MTLEKNGNTINISDPDFIAGYLNSGWNEVQKKVETKKKPAKAKD